MIVFKYKLMVHSNDASDSVDSIIVSFGTRLMTADDEMIEGALIPL